MISWGDVPSWALAVIALLALIAAVAAYFKQADAAGKLADQVNLQRNQLNDQQEANRKQSQVVDAQLREMQQRAEAFERQHADAVTFTTDGKWGGRVPGLRERRGGADVYMAAAGNEWHRPIRNVVCRIQPAPGDLMHEAALTGRMIRVRRTTSTPEDMPDLKVVDVAEQTKVDLLRAGDTAVFVFPWDVTSYPDAKMTLRFTDDAGLPWQIDHDLHLEKLDSRNDW